MNLIHPLSWCLACTLLAAQDPGQELPRQNEITDATTKNWYTSHSPNGPGAYTPPVDMSEKQMDGAQGGGVSAIRPEAWPADRTVLEAKSLPEDLGVPAYDRQETLNANGRRVLGLELKPGEKLEFHLQGQEDRVVMRTYIPNPPPVMRWKLELMEANRPLRARRAKYLKVENPTGTPQTLFLILYGACGYPYRIEMKSTGKQG